MGVLGVAARKVAGYEYQYSFSVDDEIAKSYKLGCREGKKTYLFEIRTNFIMKTINGEDQIMDSEKFDAILYQGIEEELMMKVEYRLAVYWMTNDEINRFVQEAFGFAIQKANDPEDSNRWLIPTVVNLNVRTVQQEGETVDSVIDRAIREEKLVPFIIWPLTKGVRREQYDRYLLRYLLRLFLGLLKLGEGDLGRQIRVEDVGEGLEIMPVCDICSRGPMLGTYISVLPSCNHAFHSHCIVKRMLGENYFCPTCQVRAYPYTQGWY